MIIKKIIILIAIIIWLAVCLPLIFAAYLLKKKAQRDALACGGFKILLRLLGVRLRVVGTLSENRPLLLVSNHVSYLDIPVLGSAVACRFAPKKDIASWPVIGWICRILDAVFVDRRLGRVQEAKQAVRNALYCSAPVVLFPEATTGDGRKLLNFHSAIFSIAEDDKDNIEIQPVAIAYRRIGGLPIDYGKWPLIAWYGDMSLLPHLWNLLALGKIDVELHFLKPLEKSGYNNNRKILASKAHAAIEAVLLS